MISPDNPTFEEKLTLNTHNGAQYEHLKQSSIPSHLRLALLLPCVVIEEQVIEGVQLLLQLVHALRGAGDLLEVSHLVYQLEGRRDESYKSVGFVRCEMLAI